MDFIKNPANSYNQTIIACATPRAQSALAIVRLSGKKSHVIAKQVAGATGKSAQARLVRLRDKNGEMIDQVIQLVFHAPASFTGEDMVEWYCHGNPLIVDMLLSRACELGARSAQPGEFTRRAFINNKLDISQAEAIAGLIHASSRRAARLANKALAGGMKKFLQPVEQSLEWCRVQLEAAIDFSDEDIEPARLDSIITALKKLQEDSKILLQKATANLWQSHSPQIVLTGEPNVGKSSLFNALLGNDRAIVNRQPGTTRDLLRENCNFGDIQVTMCDSAGIRESDDEIEQAGIELAYSQMADADLILLVFDARKSPPKQLTEKICTMQTDRESGEKTDIKLLLIANKTDLCDSQERTSTIDCGKQTLPVIYVSASKGKGLDILRNWLIDNTLPPEPDENAFLMNKRHIDALQQFQELLGQATDQLSYQSIEIAAELLTRARERLGELVGQQHNEQLLDAIFSGFCIGK